MIKAFLCGSKDKVKSAYLWNTSAAMLNAFQTVFILMLISRIDPVIDAGIFTIAFAIGNLMLSIGKFGVRQFQVSDVKETYSFKEYVFLRILTCVLMILAFSAYVGYYYAVGAYSTEKCLVILLVCMTKVVDAAEDVLHGMLQQHIRLDIAGKILTIRIASYIIVYLIIYAATQNLLMVSLIALAVSVVQFLILNYIAFKEFDIQWKQGVKWFQIWNLGRECFPLFIASYLVIYIGNAPKYAIDKVKEFDIQWKQGVKWFQIWNLGRECFPLFIASYLVIYIGNAPKYAIDKVMSSEAQACFTYIFMPVFVISLLSQFVYQPVISKMALLWHEKNIPLLKKMIFKQISLIIVLSAAAVLGGYILGVPVLSIIYGVNLEAYKTPLVILLFGGGALAFVNFLQMIITIARKQNWLIIGYLLAFFVFLFFGKIVVEYYGIVGISTFYTLVVSEIGIIFAVLTIGIIRKSRNEK